MQVHHVGYRIRGFYRIAALGHLWEMTPKDAQRRLEILRFFDKQMNAHAERFNRTIQESFVGCHEDSLFTDPALFNQKPADWLVFHNAQRPPYSLGQLSPLSFLLQHQPGGQRYRTHTRTCIPVLYGASSRVRHALSCPQHRLHRS